MLALVRGDSNQRRIEVGHAFAVLGGNRNRFAQSQAERLEDPLIARPSLSLVGRKDNRLVAPSQNLREHFVHRDNAIAAIDDEEGDVGFVERTLRLNPHPRFQAFVRDVFEPGGVDQL